MTIETRIDAPSDYANQISFARHAFDNYQSLIRAADAKAGALLGVAVFLGASVFQISKDAVQHIGWKGLPLELTSIAFVSFSSIFFALLLSLLSTLTRVIKPRGARFYKETKPSENLLWQDHIARHPDNGAYFEAISETSAKTILRNLTDQVFELASISREKMGTVNVAFKLLYFVILSWVFNIVTSLLLVWWK